MAMSVYENNTYSKFNSILRLFIFNDCPHFKIIFKCTCDMVGCLASLNAALDTRTITLFT